MITFLVEENNTLSQDSYNSCLNSIQFHQLKCSCGHSGCLRIHGYYPRKVKTHEGSFVLNVCRVRCSFCGRTHALLPSSLVPYSQITLACCCQAIAALCGGGSAGSVCGDYPEVDENNVKSVIRRFRKHWKERLLSLRMGIRSIRELVLSCFCHYSAQFMQIHRTGNVLHAQTTRHYTNFPSG